jgi:hypothetical protein
MKVALATLSLLSDAVHVTVVLPGKNTVPDAGPHVTRRPPSTASVAVGSVYVTLAPLVDVAYATMVPGTFLNTGGVVSSLQPGMGVGPGQTAALPLQRPGD